MLRFLFSWKLADLLTTADLAAQFRQAATYVDRILRGARPADLLVQPTKFKLVINTKAAKGLGITVPQSLLVTADELMNWRCFAAMHFVRFWHIANIPTRSTNVRFGERLGSLSARWSSVVGPIVTRYADAAVWFCCGRPPQPK